MTGHTVSVRPIHTEEDHDAVVARIEKLMSAEYGSPEGDELDVLATLVDAYEAKHFPMDAPDPVFAIEFMMDQKGLTRKDLEPMIGSRARVSEVMNRKRGLTLPMIRRVRSGLGDFGGFAGRDGKGREGGAEKLASCDSRVRRLLRMNGATDDRFGIRPGPMQVASPLGPAEIILNIWPRCSTRAKKWMSFWLSSKEFRSISICVWRGAPFEPLSKVQARTGP